MLSQHSYSNSSLVSVPTLRGTDFVVSNNFSEPLKPLLGLLNACFFILHAGSFFGLKNRFIELWMIITEAPIPHSTNWPCLRISAAAQRICCIFDFIFRGRQT